MCLAVLTLSTIDDRYNAIKAFICILMGNYDTEGRPMYPECLNNSCVIFSSFNIFHFVSFISESYNTYLRILSPHRPYQELNT